jgi:hypothetical protein
MVASHLFIMGRLLVVGDKGLPRNLEEKVIPDRKKAVLAGMI